MLTADLDDLDFNVESDDGQLVRRQLEKVVLSRGVWATVLFLYEDRDRETGAWKSPRMSVVRFQKWKGAYRKHSGFSVTDKQQAQALLDVFERWTPRMQTEPDDEADSEGTGGH